MRYTKSICYALLFAAATTASLSAQNVGIQQANPISRLDINGNVTVGNAFSGISAAPANGMNIQGAVVIGRATPLYGNDKTSSFVADDNYSINSYVSNGQLGGGGFIASAAFYGNVDGAGGVGLFIDHLATGDYGALINANGIGAVAALKGDSDTPDAHGLFGENPTGGLGYAVYANGDVFTTGTYTPSDARTKQNVAAYTSGLATVMSLQTKSYQYKSNLVQNFNFPSGTQIGFLAQDLEQVLPAAVREGRIHPLERLSRAGSERPATEKIEPIEIKTVNYAALIPVLTQAIQEQQAQIEALQTEVESLKRQVEGRK